ncbi:hypothetical protein KIN20_004171 [Parelaphostrongylus tenuis]|uniref:Uncharacterized protein n=1 Tax=Parelaphostrongylus tenuis TaxID=148309 RepID=A0AAD5MQY2_PARTN|nr:hypothetical protein KIN20_004171 [Parelaphostrongylus tenuis]
MIIGENKAIHHPSGPNRTESLGLLATWIAAIGPVMSTSSRSHPSSRQGNAAFCQTDKEKVDRSELGVAGSSAALSWLVAA